MFKATGPLPSTLRLPFCDIESCSALKPWKTWVDGPFVHLSASCIHPFARAFIRLLIHSFIHSVLSRSLTSCQGLFYVLRTYSVPTVAGSLQSPS